jgi:hypothetical protein
MRGGIGEATGPGATWVETAAISRIGTTGTTEIIRIGATGNTRIGTTGTDTTGTTETGTVSGTTGRTGHTTRNAISTTTTDGGKEESGGERRIFGSGARGPGRVAGLIDGDRQAGLKYLD